MTERISSICKLQFLSSIVLPVERPQKNFVFAGLHLLNSEVVHTVLAPSHYLIPEKF